MRKIAVITGTRAEYGLLYWTLRELQTRAELQLIVTGAHLSPAYGMTVNQIEADGIPIAAKVDMQLEDDSPAGLTHSMGIGLGGMAAAFSRLKPDLVVILGDRYEMLMTATAAAMLHIPIAHLHGGEVTEGALDESLRHAITKLSYWHFASAQAYAKRIAQLGEDPARIFTVGAPGIDQFARLPLLNHATLEKELGMTLASPVIMLTYHPETLSAVPPQDQIHTVIAGLKKIPDATLLIAGANADSGGRAINEALQSFAAMRTRALFRLSFGSLLYLSALREADLIVGNSSSGVIETPALGKASVNIGDRQAGRLRAQSVIDCTCDAGEIEQAIRKALSPEFQKKLKPSPLFGTPGNVSQKIVEKLLAVSIPAMPRKNFHDL